MTAFKFHLGDDVRRWTTEDVAPSLDILIGTARSLYFDMTTNIRLAYRDQDGDIITLASEEDVSEMLRQKLSPTRIYVAAVHNDDGGDTAVVEATVTDTQAHAMELCDDQEKNINCKEFCNTWKNADKVTNSEIVWSFEAVADFVNCLAMQLTLSDVDSVCFAEAIKLLDQCNGNLNEEGFSSVVSCLRHASEINPRVKAKLRQASKIPEEINALPIDVPHHVRLLLIRALGEPSSDTVPIHDGVSCDDCGMSPIQGRRYKSLNRPNFDLCSRCYPKDGKAWSKDMYISFFTPAQDMQQAFMGHVMNMAPMMHHAFGDYSGCGMRRGCPSYSRHCPRPEGHTTAAHHSETSGEPSLAKKNDGASPSPSIPSSHENRKQQIP